MEQGYAAAIAATRLSRGFFIYYSFDQGRFSSFIQDLYFVADTVKCDVSVGQAL